MFYFAWIFFPFLPYGTFPNGGGISFHDDLLYTALKKSYKLEAILSLLYETMFLVPVAVGMVLYYEINGMGAFGVASNFQFFLLSLIGFCTAVPLILFTMGANRITMVNLGIIEYISPSITLLLGIFLFKEAFETVQFISFVIIWIGLVCFTYGEYKEVESCPGFQESPSGR